MQSTVAPWLLWLRAAVVGTVVFSIGSLSHVAADGNMPGAAVSGLLLLICVVLAAPFLERPASRRRLAVLVVGGQTALHTALSLSGGHGSNTATSAATPSVTAPQAPTLPVVDGRRIGSLREAYDAGMSQAASLTSDGPGSSLFHFVEHTVNDAPMMLAHTLAALLVGLCCGYGEQLLWAAISLASSRFAAPPVPVPLAVPGRCGGRVRRTTRTVATSLWHVSPLSRRGPPIWAA